MHVHKHTKAYQVEYLTYRCVTNSRNNINNYHYIAQLLIIVGEKTSRKKQIIGIREKSGQGIGIRKTW